MTKEEARSYIRRIEAFLDRLPEKAEVTDISLSGDGYILLYGEFDFRKFAESNGADVQAELCKSDALSVDFVSLSAHLFGYRVLYSIFPDERRYSEELQRCGSR